MNVPSRIRAAVVVVAVGLTVLAVPTAATAQDAPPVVEQAGGAPAVTGRFDGSKGETDGGGGAQANAVGDVTISSQGCSPDPVAYGGQTTCTYAVQNQTASATTVDLGATGDSELAVVGADQGATVAGGTASAQDVTLPGRPSGPIQVNPGSTFAGYYPLETIPIGPQTISDDQILNYTVQPFRWNGATYTSLGISANGYAVVGGADTAKDATAAPQNVPDASRPNNVLAPFWTDLTPAGGGSLRVATVANSAEAPCVRSYWFVAQWDMFEFGTTTKRKAQLWIQADDPECATDPVPPETVYFTYDHSTMTTAPVRPFRVAAENSTGTVGGMRPAGELPTDDFVVTSSGTAQPAPVVTWKVTGQGTAAGTGTVGATVSSSLIPGSSTVFTDVAVSAQALPTMTDQPDDVSVTSGQQAVFGAAATGASSVRWQTSSGGGWTDVPGATSSTLAFTAAAADDGHQYRAVFANSSGGETTSNPATLTVAKRATTTSVTASPAAPKVGQAVSFTATVAPSGATGTVQFKVDGTNLGSPVAVSGGSATSTSTSSLAAGDHPVTATYSGDAEHAGSVGNTTVSVGKVASTVTVAVDPVAPKVGEDVGFTATVAPSGATGTVQFSVDGTNLGSPVAVSGGSATSTDLAGLSRGTHLVQASYSGDGTYAAATTGPVSFEVTRRSTTTVASVDPASPVRGEPVTLSATVDTAPGGGTVQFTVDGSPFGSPVAVIGDTATAPASTSFTAGAHTVTAAFSGSDTHAPSTSAPKAFTVAKKDSSTTVLSVQPGTLSAGEDVEVDLAVSPVPVGGTVQLALDGTDVGGPISLTGGEATATVPDVLAGSHTLTATFSGDDDLLTSSDSEDLVVYDPDEAFVRRAFPLVLGRPADSGGVTFWVGKLHAGLSPDEVGRRLATSTEARRRLVEEDFQQVLNRPVDSGGRTYWVQRLSTGTTAEQFLASLIASPEAYQRGGNDPEGVALTLYRVHLARTADSGGLAHWRTRVASANTPAGRAHVAMTFGRSTEATRVAVAAATSAACGTAPIADAGVLTTSWTTSGHNPLVVRARALALSCPPEGLAITPD